MGNEPGVLATLVEMLGYVLADAYPTANVPEKLQEIADALGRKNPFESGGALNDLLSAEEKAQSK